MLMALSKALNPAFRLSHAQWCRCKLSLRNAMASLPRPHPQYPRVLYTQLPMPAAVALMLMAL